MFALADCNNFFVSCERVFRPELEGKPVIVLSGNDGCVIARSNEVKALGIKMGAPLFRIRDIVERYNIACFSSNFELYGDLSSRVMHILSHYTDRLEQYSIDEAFLWFDNSIGSLQLKQLTEQIVREIRRGTGIPVSIGVATSRTLAKVASKYAKQYPGYKGSCLIDSDEKRVKALSEFDITDVWGVGRRSRLKLRNTGIRTALDLANKSHEYALNMMNLPGLRIWQELNGSDVIDVDDLAQHLSITRSRTFAHPVTDLASLESYIADFCSACASKLRSQKSVCNTVVVFALPSRYETFMSYGYLQQDELKELRSSGGIYAEINLPVATDITSELLESILLVMRRQFKTGFPYKRAGIILQNIIPANSSSLRLFDDRNRKKEQDLLHAVDNLNNRHGKNTVVLATQIKTDDMASKLQQRFFSPCYSTRLSDIITVKC